MVAEPVQPAELTLTEPMQTDEIVEPTEVASMLSEDKITVEPLIFGVREDQLGQVITIEPDQSEISAVVAAQEVVEPEKEPIIPTNVKWILAGLAAAFGLIWLLLKLQRYTRSHKTIRRPGPWSRTLFFKDLGCYLRLVT